LESLPLNDGPSPSQLYRVRKAKDLRSKYLAKVGIYYRDHVHVVQHSHSAVYHPPPVETSDQQSTMQQWIDFLNKRTKWYKKAWNQKLMLCFIFPISVALDLTVPSVKAKYYNRWITALYPIFSPLVILLALNGFGIQFGVVPLWALIESIGLMTSAIVWLTTTHDQPPYYYPVFIMSSFVLSMIWIFVAANEIVALLEAVGVIFNISQAILGITVLAWGNSISDLVANLMVAKKGLQGMAVAACFGGPLFNMLAGLGLGFLIKCGASFPDSVDIGGGVPVKLLVGFLFLIVTLVLVLIVVPCHKYHVPRKFGIVLCSLYLLFSIFSIVLETAHYDNVVNLY